MRILIAAAAGVVLVGALAFGGVRAWSATPTTTPTAAERLAVWSKTHPAPSGQPLALKSVPSSVFEGSMFPRQPNAAMLASVKIDAKTAVQDSGADDGHVQETVLADMEYYGGMKDVLTPRFVWLVVYSSPFGGLGLAPAVAPLNEAIAFVDPVSGQLIMTMHV